MLTPIPDGDKEQMSTPATSNDRGRIPLEANDLLDRLAELTGANVLMLRWPDGHFETFWHFKETRHET